MKRQTSGILQFIIMAIILLSIMGCKKASDASIASSSPEASTDSVVQKIKETASQITSSQAANVTGEIAQQAGQTILVPIEQKLPNGVITPDYKSPCFVEKYRGLNVACRGMTIWHNYSTLTSWYVSYSLVLLGLVVAVIIIWWIKRSKS